MSISIALIDHCSGQFETKVLIYLECNLIYLACKIKIYLECKIKLIFFQMDPHLPMTLLYYMLRRFVFYLTMLTKKRRMTMPTLKHLTGSQKINLEDEAPARRRSQWASPPFSWSGGSFGRVQATSWRRPRPSWESIPSPPISLHFSPYHTCFFPPMPNFPRRIFLRLPVWALCGLCG